MVVQGGTDYSLGWLSGASGDSVEVMRGGISSGPGLRLRLHHGPQGPVHVLPQVPDQLIAGPPAGTKAPA